MNGTCSPSRLQLGAQPSAVLKLDGHPDGFKGKGMHNPAEDYYVTVPPVYEDIEDEIYRPFPPPVSPIFAQFPRKQTTTSGWSTQGDGDEKFGGTVLSQMEEQPMTTQRKAQGYLDIEKLLSEKGISALRDNLCNMTFKGQGFEVENLHTLLGGVESWACQLYPQHTFDDLVSQLEELGNHSAVQGCVRSLHQQLPPPLPSSDFTMPGDGDPEEACESPLLSDSEEGEGLSSKTNSPSRENS